MTDVLWRGSNEIVITRECEPEIIRVDMVPQFMISRSDRTHFALVVCLLFSLSAVAHAQKSGSLAGDASAEAPSSSSGLTATMSALPDEPHPGEPQASGSSSPQAPQGESGSDVRRKILPVVGGPQDGSKNDGCQAAHAH